MLSKNSSLRENAIVKISVCLYNHVVPCGNVNYMATGRHSINFNIITIGASALWWYISRGVPRIWQGEGQEFFFPDLENCMSLC